MTMTIEALFDGIVFRPVEPISLAPNKRVQLTVRTELSDEQTDSFLQTALALQLDGPPDWSAKIEDYLYHGYIGEQGHEQGSLS